MKNNYISKPIERRDFLMKIKRKRIFALLLAIMTAVSVTACGSGETAAQNSSETSSALNTESTDNIGSAENNESSDNTEISESVDSAENAENTESGESTDNTENAEFNNETVKSDGYEKFSQIEIGMIESEVNAILGEPTKVDKAYYYYNITVNGQDMEIQVWINTVSGLVIYKTGNFGDREYLAEFADSATDFSAVDDLESGALNTYEDCANAFKAPGYLISLKDDGTERYLWADDNGGHLCITFGADGTVKSYEGYC